MNTKQIAIIGAGPGGLATGMLLAKRGYGVNIYEKADRVGGRNARIELGTEGAWKFDTGPTILVLPRILEELFIEAGKSLADYAELVKVDPLFHLRFSDFDFEVTLNREKMREQIERLFPGNADGYDRFLADEEKRFSTIFPLLQKRYFSWTDLLDKRVLRAIPDIKLGRSLIGLLEDYFTDERLRLAFTFQSKYIGMSPWKTPALFGILPYIEHHYGVYHVTGGLNQLSAAMAEVCTELGAKIHLSTPVKRIRVENKRAIGLELESGDHIDADDIVVGADISHAFTHLFPSDSLRKWTPKKLARTKYSCSTFMAYLALDKEYDLPHNTIVFSKDYKDYVERLANEDAVSDDVSIYVCNPAATDKTMAPSGASALYILVPVSNLRDGTNWKQRSGEMYENVLKILEQQLGLEDIRQHIVDKKILTPEEWETDYAVHLGAVFNMGHQLSQMMFMRPHNKFEELEHCYIVGGGTHPGSGLPTIYESGRITANAIDESYGVKRTEPDSLGSLW